MKKPDIAQVRVELTARMDRIEVHMDRTSAKIDRLGDKLDAFMRSLSDRKPATKSQ